MTKEELIAIYIEVSNKLCNGTEWCWAGVDEPLQLFAKLVAQAEREACAKMAENRVLIEASDIEKIAHYTACKNIASGIRARGQE